MSENSKVQKFEKRMLLTLFGAISLLVLIFVGSLLIKSPDLDEVTQCPKDPAQQESRATVFLIDLTDHLEGMKASNAAEIARSLSRTLRKSEKFSIFVLKSGKTSSLSPIYAGCNPGQPTWADYISKGRRDLRGKFEDTFAGKLDEAIKREMANQSGSKESPIIEAIRDITHSQHWGRSNRLYILSDLLENSAIASLYDPTKTFDSVIKSAAGSVVKSIDLSRSVVGLCMIDRPLTEVAPGAQGNATKFWKLFFDYAGARCVEAACQITGSECADALLEIAKSEKSHARP